MIASSELHESLMGPLLRETVSAATALGEVREGQRRQHLELMAITTRLTAVEEAIRGMKTMPLSSSTPTGTPTETAMRSVWRRMRPPALKWVGEKALTWVTYYLTPALLVLWGFAQDQFWALMSNLASVIQLGLRLFGG